jgi:hypothetical protein
MSVDGMEERNGTQPVFLKKIMTALKRSWSLERTLTYDWVTLEDSWLISILVDNEFLNSVILFIFLTLIGGEKLVAGFTKGWFEIVLYLKPDELLSYDAGNK